MFELKKLLQTKTTKWIIKCHEAIGSSWFLSSIKLQDITNEKIKTEISTANTQNQISKFYNNMVKIPSDKTQSTFILNLEADGTYPQCD